MGTHIQLWNKITLAGPRSGSVLTLQNPIDTIGDFYWKMLEGNRALRQQITELLDEVPGLCQAELKAIRNAHSSRNEHGKLWVSRKRPIAVTQATDTTPSELLLLAGDRTDSVVFFRGNEEVLQLLRNALTNIDNQDNQVGDQLGDTWIPDKTQSQELMRRKSHEVPQGCIANPDHPLARRFIVALSEYAQLKDVARSRDINQMILGVFPKVGDNLELCRHHWCTLQGIVADGKIDKDLLSIRLEEVIALERVASEIREAEDISDEHLTDDRPKSIPIKHAALAEEEIQMVKKTVTPPPSGVSKGLAEILFGAAQKGRESDPILQDLQDQLQKAKLFEVEAQELVIQQQQGLDLAGAKVDELEQQLLAAREEMQVLQGVVHKSNADLEQVRMQQQQLQSQIAEVEASAVPQLSEEQVAQLDALIEQLTTIRGHQK
jgi:hypothetical protein